MPMHLSADNLAYLAEIAGSAAEKAGALIADAAQQPVQVDTKPVGDSLASQVVTEVDRQSEQLILETLQPTLADFDLGLLSEECGDDGSRLQKDYFWCIDPIDGTLSFIDGEPGYAVSIGLLSKNAEALIGVVFDPSSQTLYSAVRGQGLSLNHQPWQPLQDMASDMNAPAEKPLTLVIDRSLKQGTYYQRLLEQCEAIAAEIQADGLQVLSNGGAVINGCRVLEQAPACYFKLPKPQDGGGSLWDFAAITCLFAEAGGVATDFYGQPLKLNNPDTTFMNADGVLFATDEKLAEQISRLT